MAASCLTNVIKADKLKDILPEDAWDVCHVCSIVDDPLGFKATFRMPFTTVKEVQDFIASFSMKTYVTWRVTHTNPQGQSAGLRNIFWKGYHCQHSNIAVSSNVTKKCKKYTNCKARMIITIKKVSKRNQSKNPHMPRLPTIIVLDYIHNHQLQSLDALRIRDVSPHVAEKFKELYLKGHSPLSALKTHRHDLHEEYGDSYYKAACDRYQCPDFPWCYRLYFKQFNKKYSDPKASFPANLEEKVKEINANSPTPVAKIDISDEYVVVAVCSPLMKRVHKQLPQSAEAVFLESFGGLHRCKHHVFLLLTHSCAGGLPLGVFATSLKSTAAIKKGLEMVTMLAGADAFHGNSINGPRNFMTDDCLTEQNAVLAVFPKAQCLLCIFCILQAAWKWLWDSKNGIVHPDHAALLGLLKNILFANSEIDVVITYETALNDPTARKYKKFIKYLEEKWEKRQEWAVAFMSKLPVQGSNTNNSAEGAIRVTRNTLLHRLRGYNLIQLLHFINTRCDIYYEKRILDVLSNRLDSIVKPCYCLPSVEECDALKTTQLSLNTFQVTNEKNIMYEVSMDLGICSCPTAINGAPCKHQFVVGEEHTTGSYNFVPTDNPEMRNLLHKIATGSSADLGDAPLQFMDTEPAIEENSCDSSAAASGYCGETYLQSDEDHLMDTDMESNKAVMEEWENFSTLIKGKLAKCPETFTPAVTAFIRNVSGLKTDAAIASAFITFGEVCKTYRTSCPVQPTSEWRQLEDLQSGSIADEHAYGIRIKSFSTLWSQVLPHT